MPCYIYICPEAQRHTECTIYVRSANNTLNGMEVHAVRPIHYLTLIISKDINGSGGGGGGGWLTVSNISVRKPCCLSYLVHAWLGRQYRLYRLVVCRPLFNILPPSRFCLPPGLVSNETHEIMRRFGLNSNWPSGRVQRLPPDPHPPDSCGFMSPVHVFVCASAYYTLRSLHHG